MDRDKQLLIDECANKVSRNDLPYEYIKRTITELVEACEGKADSTSEKDLRVCEVSGSLFSDSEILDWLHIIMSPDSDYCEVFLAGLRDFKQGYATAFQVESNPERFKTVNAPTLREAISLAMIAYNDR